ncbi:MAG: HupE/UreJ family protein [Planctomycetales bacterium]
MKPTLSRICLCGSLLLLVPRAACAHLVDTRCGPFYDGFCHSFVTPTDLMIVLALALLAGFGGPAAGRRALWSFFLSWTVGAVIGSIGLDRTFALPVLLLAGGSLVVSLLVAANVSCPMLLLGFLGLVIGCGLGLSNGAEFSSLKDGGLALVGNGTCVLVLATWVTALAVKSDQGWKRIVLRVAGSWIAAASLLMIGWELRK